MSLVRYKPARRRLPRFSRLESRSMLSGDTGEAFEFDDFDDNLDGIGAFQWLSHEIDEDDDHGEMDDDEFDDDEFEDDDDYAETSITPSLTSESATILSGQLEQIAEDSADPLEAVAAADESLDAEVGDVLALLAPTNVFADLELDPILEPELLTSLVTALESSDTASPIELGTVATTGAPSETSEPHELSQSPRDGGANSLPASGTEQASVAPIAHSDHVDDESILYQLSVATEHSFPVFSDFVEDLAAIELGLQAFLKESGEISEDWIDTLSRPGSLITAGISVAGLVVAGHATHLHARRSKEAKRLADEPFDVRLYPEVFH